jgi:hypothetical protein
MSKALDDALEHLTTTYQSLAQAAVGYREVLDAKEINARLAKSIPDTAEHIALKQLAFLLQTPIIESTPAQPTAPQEPIE